MDDIKQSKPSSYKLKYIRFKLFYKFIYFKPKGNKIICPNQG